MITKNPANADVYRTFQAPRVGLEPTTPRLTAVCSTIELSRIILFFCTFSSVCDRVVALPLSYRGMRAHTLRTEHRTAKTAVWTRARHARLLIWLSSRPISVRQLCASPRLHPAPIYPVLSGGAHVSPHGHLFSGRASRLDAFSAYPCRAWLPCRGGGPPTGAPAARPSRSSRTGDGSPQVSRACAG